MHLARCKVRIWEQSSLLKKIIIIRHLNVKYALGFFLPCHIEMLSFAAPSPVISNSTFPINHRGYWLAWFLLFSSSSFGLGLPPPLAPCTPNLCFAHKLTLAGLSSLSCLGSFLVSVPALEIFFFLQLSWLYQQGYTRHPHLLHFLLSACLLWLPAPFITT